MLLNEIIRQIVLYAIYLLQSLMFIRAVLSWFPAVQIDALNKILYYTTEPLIAPVRRFLHRFQSIRYLPIDISWLVVYLLLYLITIII